MSKEEIAAELAALKVIADAIAARRAELVAEAQETMRAGTHIAAEFGDELAAWVWMAKPAVRASVTDPDKLLAWARENAPHHIQTVERLDPQWVSDALTGMKRQGYIVTFNGEKVEDLPGVTVDKGDPVLTVKLEPDASVVVGKAWRDGKVPLPSLLALPSPEGEPDAT